MKVKVKYTSTRKFILNFEKETLGELTEAVVAAIKENFGDEVNVIALSLNGKDPLLGAGKSLSELGIVSSDLVTVLLGESALDAILHDSKDKASIVAPKTTAVAPKTTAVAPSTSSGNNTASSSETVTCKPSYLIDVKDSSSLPITLESLLQSCQTSSPSHVINLLAHLTMMECGYIPLPPIDGNQPPKGWDSLASNLNYVHKSFEGFSCTLVLVTMGDKKHILISFPKQDVEITTIIVTKDYVLQNPSSGPVTSNELFNIARLSQKLRNELLVPLQLSAHRILGLPSPFHLAGLPIELLLKIFKYLDTKSALTLSQCCKRLNQTISDESTWQFYFLRDFNFSNKSKDTWYLSYKEKYQKMHVPRHEWESPLCVVPGPRIYPRAPPHNPFQPQPMGPYPMYPNPAPPINPFADPDSPYFGGDIPNVPGVGPHRGGPPMFGDPPFGGDPMNPFGDPGLGGMGPGLPNPRRPRGPNGGFGGPGGFRFI